MRLLSTILVLSLSGFALSNNAREFTVFGGFTFLDTETTQTVSMGNMTDTTIGLESVRSGSRTGFGALMQSFEDDGIYFSSGFQRTEGDYEFCVAENCTDLTLRVDELNIAVGWSRPRWTPFLDLSWSDTESSDPSVYDSETNSDIGIGLWYQSKADVKLKFKVNDLRDHDTQTITVGFQRELQNYFTIDGSFMYPLNQDVSGYGFRFAVGWTL